jgi:hypothetical protein
VIDRRGGGGTSGTAGGEAGKQRSYMQAAMASFDWKIPEMDDQMGCHVSQQPRERHYATLDASRPVSILAQADKQKAPAAVGRDPLDGRFRITYARTNQQRWIGRPGQKELLNTNTTEKENTTERNLVGSDQLASNGIG